MPLPTIFNNVAGGVQEPGANLDACLNALGQMGVTYCTATGTNAITLTPVTSPGHPTVSSPPANLQRFGFAATATTTGLVTAQIGSGTFFPVFLPGGTSQASTNNILQTAYYDLAFLTALNSGSGGFMMVGAQAGALAAPRGLLAGLTLSNDVTLPNTVLDVSAGQCVDSTNTLVINLGAFTKSTAGAWTAGTGNNGMGNGLTIANSTWYHPMAIIKGGLPDMYFDTDPGAANKPAGTTAFRRLGSFLTDGAAHIIAFLQFGDYFEWFTAVQDQNTTLGTIGTNFVVSAPLGVRTLWQGQAFISNPTNNAGVRLYTPSQADVA